MSDDLAAIVHTAHQLAYWYPRAEAFSDQGDGLRSPNLDGGSHGSGVADPVGDHVAGGVDHDPLRAARGHIASARRALVFELASTGGTVPAGLGADDIAACATIAETLGRLTA